MLKKFLKWLLTPIVYVVTIEDYSMDSIRIEGIALTRWGARKLVKKLSNRRWARIDSESDKWLVRWNILEKEINL